MSVLRYDSLAASAGAKKWISPTAKADLGNSQALFLPPGGSIGSYGIAVGAATLTNRSGGAAVVGLGVRYSTSVWEAGSLTSAGAYTAATLAAQDAVLGDFTLHDRADSGSGFLVGSGVPFNALAIIQSAVGDQTTPVKIVEYWDGAAWSAITASLFISDTLDPGAVGERLLVWPTPSDWVLGGTGTGVPAGRYNLRVRHTTSGAGTANPMASQLFVGSAKMLVPSLGNNSQAALIREHEYAFPRQGDGLFPIFSVADRGNTVEADVRVY